MIIKSGAKKSRVDLNDLPKWDGIDRLSALVDEVHSDVSQDAQIRRLRVHRWLDELLGARQCSRTL